MKYVLKNCGSQCILLFSCIWLFLDLVSDVVITVIYKTTCDQCDSYSQQTFQLYITCHTGIHCGYFYASLSAIILPMVFACILNIFWYPEERKNIRQWIFFVTLPFSLPFVRFYLGIQRSVDLIVEKSTIFNYVYQPLSSLMINAMYLASHGGFVMKNYLLIISAVFSLGSLFYGIFNVWKLCLADHYRIRDKDLDLDDISKLNSLRPLCLNTNLYHD